MFPYITILGKVIPMYSAMIAVGAIAAILYLKLNEGRRIFPAADMELVLVYSIIGLFIGAKLLSLLTVLPDFLSDLPLLFSDTDAFLNEYVYGGFVFYGGLIGALTAAWLYCRITRLPFYDLARLAMPVIPLFHAFGRIGCFCVGCCYGCPTDILGIAFEASPIAPNGIPLFPVQLVEAAAELILFAVLALMSRKEGSGKKMIGVWLLCYSVLRFVLEYFRADAYRGFLGTLSTSQCISLMLLAVAVCLLVRRPAPDFDNTQRTTL